MAGTAAPEREVAEPLKNPHLSHACTPFVDLQMLARHCLQAVGTVLGSIAVA